MLRSCKRDAPSDRDGRRQLDDRATRPSLAASRGCAREHDALLYVDDAHGFGVVGERSPDEPATGGRAATASSCHQGESYDNVIFVAGFSKSYSSLLSFLALPTRLKDVLKVAAPPYLYSGPSPVASLATTLVGLEVNDKRGDLARYEIFCKTDRVLRCLRELDIYTPNHSGYPVIEVPLTRHEDIDAVGRYLFDRGIYVTLAAYPLVPKEEVGFRIQVTAANTDDEIERLCTVLGEIDSRFDLSKTTIDGAARRACRPARAGRDKGPVAKGLGNAEALSAAGDYAAALLELDGIVASEPAKPAVHTARGWALENLGPERLADARAAYERA